MARLQELLTQSTIQNLGLGEVLAVRAQEAQQLRQVMNEQAKAQVEAVKAAARGRRETGETLGALLGAGAGALMAGKGQRLEGAALGAGLGQAVGGQLSGAVRQPGVTTGADIATQALQTGAQIQQQKRLIQQQKQQELNLKQQEFETKKIESNTKIAQGLIEKGIATPEEAEKFKQTGDFSVISKKTGASSLTAKEKMNAETTIRKEFQNLTKDFRNVRDSFARVQASGEDPSAAGDLALIFNYMKILDPGSVVRETEFATAQNAAGVPERVRAQFNRVLSGERLSSQQRNDFLNRSSRLFNTRKEQFDQTSDEYKNLSDRLGLNYKNIVLKSDRPLIQKKRQKELEEKTKKEQNERKIGGILIKDLTQEEKQALTKAGLLPEVGGF